MAFIETVPVNQATGEVRAMMAFAERVAKDASSITARDVEGLRAHGFTDAEIFDIAARCFFSKLLDALGAEPDSAYLELEDGLRRRLLPCAA